MSTIVNYKTSNDPRFNVANARNARLKGRSFIGYSQNFNSGSQAVAISTRTQLLNDAQGANTFSTARLWNPINNRIYLLDSNVGDYVDCHVVIPYSGGVSIPTITTDLDFSASLDGSKLIGVSQIASSINVATGLEFDFTFMVTSEMKANGIGIMITSSNAVSINNAEILLENYPSITSITS